MRILLIHQNFPGQFRHLAPAWIQQGHQVWAVGCSDPARFNTSPWQGLRYLHYPAPAGDGDLASHLQRAGQVAARLAQEALDPDVVLAHSAWGEALHLRWIFPAARLVVLPELWGSPRSLGEGFDRHAIPLDLASRCRIDQLNLPAAAAIANADAAITATRSQRDSFPPLLRKAIQVIHEGVDSDALAPSANANLLLPDGQLLDRSDPVISFASRHLEPLRGIRALLQALPELLDEHPRVQVLIAGATSGGYGPAPSGSSHLADAISELTEGLDLSRIHWLGRLPYPQLVSLFQISRAHVYLSYPYALSWSLLEAMACGASIISNRDGPAAEVIRHRQHGLLVPFNDPRRLASAMLELLADPELGSQLGRAARARVQRTYNLQRSLSAYQALFQSLGLITSCKATDPSEPSPA
jgi:glycosyltransferase involved in cell wall biosynthesis